MSEFFDVNKLKVTELRAELQARGLDTKGNKPALVERLQEALLQEAQGNLGPYHVQYISVFFYYSAWFLIRLNVESSLGREAHARPGPSETLNAFGPAILHSVWDQDSGVNEVHLLSDVIWMIAGTIFNSASPE